MKTTICFFSGTGNSYAAAKIIGEKLGNAELISARCNLSDVSGKDAEVIGFVCPAHEWDVSDRMAEFIESLEINPNAYIFMVVTQVYGFTFRKIGS